MICKTSRYDEFTGETVADEIAPYYLDFRMERSAKPWSSLQIQRGSQEGITGDPTGEIVAGKSQYTLAEQMPDGTVRYYAGGLSILDGAWYYLDGAWLVKIEKPQRRAYMTMECK